MKRLLAISLALLMTATSIFAQASNQPKYGIEQYLKIRAASSPTFSPDGKQIAYLSNATGTNQVWIVPTTGGEPKQLTNYEDNISFVKFSPTEGVILFGKANGGDENALLFTMNLNGSNVRQLTNDPSVRNNVGDWTRDGKRIFYASNKRDRNYFDVYAMDVASGKDELILQQDGSNSVAAVSDDGEKIVVSRSGTEFGLDNDLYLVDVETKNAELITKHEGASQFGDVSFAKDKKSIYLTSDNNCEYLSLAIFDPKSRKIKPSCVKNFDYESVKFSPDDKALAFVSNEDGISKLSVLKVPKLSLLTFLTGAKTKPDSVNLPGNGVIGSLDISQDGEQLAFTFSSAKFNSDIWLYDFTSKRLSQLTKSDRAGIPQESFVKPELIKYKSFDGREIPAWY